MAADVAETLKTRAISRRLECMVVVPFSSNKGEVIFRAMLATGFVLARIDQARSLCMLHIVKADICSRQVRVLVAHSTSKTWT
jgi:hypothetical protein